MRTPPKAEAKSGERLRLNFSVVRSISEIDAGQWNACARGEALLQHAFFAALEQSGATGRGQRIVPKYVLLRDQTGRLAACAPAMFKTGTLAEYGPEHRWLSAGLKAGCFAWPKFQVGLPLYPVCGQKLLVRSVLRPDSIRRVLLGGLLTLAKRHNLATLNLMHIDENTARQLQQAGWLISHEIHSFWKNAGHGDFEAYVRSLPHRKRYQIYRDRSTVEQLGLRIRLLSGQEIGSSLLERYYTGYQKVCLRNGNRPWIPLAMFRSLLELLPQSIRLIAAFNGEEYVAGSFWIVDSDVLCMRTWSAMEELPGLCFELICYRPVIYAIENGLKCVDSGLYGQHKRLRGYVDEPVFSAHWFRDDSLRQLAIAELSALGQFPAFLQSPSGPEEGAG